MCAYAAVHVLIHIALGEHRPRIGQVPPSRCSPKRSQQEKLVASISCAPCINSEHFGTGREFEAGDRLGRTLSRRMSAARWGARHRFNEPAGSRHPYESATDRYSTRAASDRRSPNLAPQGCDCWPCTTTEQHRAQRQARYRARSSLPRGHRTSWCCRTYNLALLGKRSIQLHPDLEPNAAIPIDSDVATSWR